MTTGTHHSRTAAGGAARTSAGLPRLLPPVPGQREDLAAHVARRGPKPAARDLIAKAEAAGLTGRGGAAFPVHRKLSAVAQASGGQKAVVANAAESEPASEKDAALLWHAPHLVLDGLELAAEAVGATSLYLYLHRGASEHLATAIQQRKTSNITIVEAPPRFLAGQETALVNRINGGPALPTYSPPRPAERGIRRAPTLVQNVETLAHLALIARFGPDWFRTRETMLTTIHTERGKTVAEIPVGTRLTDLIDDQENPVLIGGYHGTWLPANKASEKTVGTGSHVIAVLPRASCGLKETARIVRYLAAESAGQCGPCLNGLPRMALAMAELAGPRPSARTRANLERWAGLTEGRGACRHPDGAVRLVRSALETFTAELRSHANGTCTGRTPFLPIPQGSPTTEADWR